MRDDFPTLALELFEYKMDDLRHRRPVKSGMDSVWELRRELDELTPRMEPDQRELFERLSRELGQRDSSRPRRPDTDRKLDFGDLTLGGPGEEASAAETAVSGGGTAIDLGQDLVIDLDEEPSLVENQPPASPEEKREQEALQRLAMRVFGREIERFAEGVSAAWRAERERVTARLLYATMRNYERYRDTPAFVHDANLRQFKVVEPIPDRIDPLVSLSDVDSLVVIARDLIESVLYLRESNPAPRVERSGSLDYMRRLAIAVARDPYAGKHSALVPKGPSAAELRAAIQDLARQRLPEWQRQTRRSEFEARLRERQELERSQIAMLRRDQSRFAAHIEAFFSRLEALLPRSVGGSAEEPQLVGGVVFALSAALRRNELSSEAKALTLRLAGPVRLPFAGRDLVVTVHADERHLYLENAEIPLDDDRVVRIAGDDVETFVEGSYLHLRVRASGGSLSSRVAEAATALHVLGREARDEGLAVLRMIAPGAPGEPSELVVEAVRRAGQIVAKAPDRRNALTKLVMGAAHGIGVELPADWLDGFLERAELALGSGDERLPEAVQLLDATDASAEPAKVVPFVGEPVDVSVGGRTVTIRQYGIRGADHLVAMLPGQVIGSFREHLIEPLGSGTFVCVFGDQQLVVTYLPETAIPTLNA